MKIVNWQPLFTDHQLFTWRALQTLLTEPITHVVGTATCETRVKQGWEGADLSGLDVVFLVEKDWWQRGIAIICANSEAVHVFCGYWADRRYFPLIVYALWHKANVVIINESFSSVSVGYLAEGKLLLNKIKAYLRPLLYRAATTLLICVTRGKKPALLAISLRAVTQFKQSGLRNEQIFPFGYFVPSISVLEQVKPSLGNAIRLIFVGSLLPRKGLDIAIAAVIGCQQQNIPITLAVYGVGDASKYITAETKGTTYCGTIPFGQAQATIAQYDVLILPSRHDGWGVVVNEALLQGIPVIASANVGAACMVVAHGAGAVFGNEDVEGLTQILQKLASDSTILTAWRSNANKVKALIEPELAAKYMHDVILFYFYQKGNRPTLLCCNQ